MGPSARQRQQICECIPACIGKAPTISSWTTIRCRIATILIAAPNGDRGVESMLSNGRAAERDGSHGDRQVPRIIRCRPSNPRNANRQMRQLSLRFLSLRSLSLLNTMVFRSGSIDDNVQWMPWLSCGNQKQWCCFFIFTIKFMSDYCNLHCHAYVLWWD